MTGATTLYYDCSGGNGVPYFNGTIDQMDTIGSCQVSTAMAASGTGAILINQVADVWWDAAVHTICIATDGSGHGWASDTAGSNTARGTGYSQLDNTTRPYTTNANSLTHCYNGATLESTITANQATYLGTIWTLEAAGAINVQFRPTPTVGGADPCVCLYNASNRTRYVTVTNDLTNWNPNGSAAWGPADVGATGSGLNNRVNWVDGQGIVEVSASNKQSVTNTTNLDGGQNTMWGIDFNSASAAPSGTVSQFFSQTSYTIVNGIASDTYTGTGANYVQAMEYSSGGTVALYLFQGNNPSLLNEPRLEGAY